MLQHILVPVDGSACAEQALPVAARIARSTGATMTIVRILAQPREYPYTLMDGSISMEECYDEEVREAENYLENIVYSKLLRGIVIQTELLSGLPHKLLPSLAHMKHIDLIVMCSRAATGFKRLVLGSIAQELIRSSSVPLLILRDGCIDTAISEKQFSVLVALDGTDNAEQALLPAAQLSAALSVPHVGKLHMLHIVKPRHAGQKLADETNQRAIEESRIHLNKLKDSIQQKMSGALPLEVTSSVVLDIDIPRTIIQTAEQGLATPNNPYAGYDAIAVVTHGNHGISYWFGEHVSEHMLGETRLPLLVIRLQEQAAKAGKH
ncbi:universal stress protein [Dictyobacter kobayashii]|uniref:Universal stress protein UspA n=1 Tax=Dictyobacter kobayashii TaxID=2014872 RepID=A0A402AU27_9CHLR|nr:universal stress protein [Dictyobacter kobayashii]GCE22656.1 universal stress protein UspA [Dictyobacter kobayashii]